MNLKKFVFNPFQVNTFLLYDETKEAVLIDCGCSNENELAKLLGFIEEANLQLKKIIITHPHIDHIVGVADVKNALNVPVVGHLKGNTLLGQASSYAMVFGLNGVKQFDIDEAVEDGDIITFGNSKLEVLYTPGHADGSICLYHRQTSEIFAGDVLFQGGIGRTDLPTGDYATLIDNITTKIMCLPDETKVYPGHGERTTIYDEKMQNPYL
ncbi:MAG: MBL fold metallo-hydrolase [Sphingobacteriia bacterium]|nr:MBL fold metallo-hydrolase [Sphingobacteriia bacterium]